MIAVIIYVSMVHHVLMGYLSTHVHVLPISLGHIAAQVSGIFFSFFFYKHLSIFLLRIIVTLHIFCEKEYALCCNSVVKLYT